MKKKFSILFLISLIIFQSGCNIQPNCPQEINQLPMYGKVEKCREQLEADEIFLKEMDEQEPDRKIAARSMLDAGWHYFNKGDYKTAMNRANQAWLLDSTQIVIYAVFTSILDISQRTDEAIEMLDITLDKINARENPETSTEQDSPNEDILDFIYENMIGIYREKNNPSLGKHFYTRIDDLNITESNKAALKNNLEMYILEVDGKSL